MHRAIRAWDPCSLLHSYVSHVHASVREHAGCMQLAAAGSSLLPIYSTPPLEEKVCRKEIH